MARRVTSPRARNFRATRAARAAAGVVLCAVLLLGTSTIRAQAPKEPVVDQSFSIRQDEELYQLEEVITLISSSLNIIADRAQTLAINSMHFGQGVSSDFRKKAEVIILKRLFEANPTVRLVQCQECQKLQTRIVRGILKLRKGIPSNEARIELAKKLQVDGFIDIGLFKDNNQITVYLKVVEAETGAIILVDELVGRRAPVRDALTFSFGEMIFPIEDSSGTSADHTGLVLGVSETVQLTNRFSFGVDLNFYLDSNDNNPDATITLDTGILLAPYLGFDIFQMQASASRLLFYIGIGKLLSPQLEYANLIRAGFQFIVGDRLVIVLGFNNFLETDIENSNKITGSGSELRFGYRF